MDSTQLHEDIHYSPSGGRTRAEIERIISERTSYADYERGRAQARAVMRTLSLLDAIRDLEALRGSFASPDYVAGYGYEVISACGR